MVFHVVSRCTHCDQAATQKTQTSSPMETQEEMNKIYLKTDQDWHSNIESLLNKIPPLNTKNIEKINLYLLGDINKFIDCNMEMTPLVEELKKLDDPSELIFEVKKESKTELFVRFLKKCIS